MKRCGNAHFAKAMLIGGKRYSDIAISEEREEKEREDEGESSRIRIMLSPIGMYFPFTHHQNHPDITLSSRSRRVLFFAVCCSDQQPDC